MKKKLLLTLIITIGLIIPAIAVDARATTSGKELYVTFGYTGTPFTMHMYNNKTAEEVISYVGRSDWNLPIYNYRGFTNWEIMQYYDIPRSYRFTSNPENVRSVKAGEVFYSHPNRIILFYNDGVVDASYTPLGYL